MSMIHEITPGLASAKRKRKGRGESSGMGKTCGRGNKGSKARVGRPAWKPGHEGGQTPMHRRLPKRGFSNHPFQHNFNIVNLNALEVFDSGMTIDIDVMCDGKFVPDAKLPLKILGDGTLTKKLTIKADWYSKTAVTKILAAGGEVLTAKGEKFEFPKPKKIFVKRPDAKKAVAAVAAAAPAEKK